MREAALLVRVNLRMKIGIVGSEMSRFTTEGEGEARDIIRFLLGCDGVTEVVSGGCHRGGIDKWVAEIGEELGLKVTEFLPANHSWQTGYRPRNVKIAEYSDAVHCITVAKVPEGFMGNNAGPCFHCGTNEHERSGGCWVVKRAQILGKPTKVHVIHQPDLVAKLAKEEAALMDAAASARRNPAPYFHGCFNRIFKYDPTRAAFSIPLNRERFIRIATAEAQRIIAIR